MRIVSFSFVLSLACLAAHSGVQTESSKAAKQEKATQAQEAPEMDPVVLIQAKDRELQMLLARNRDTSVKEDLTPQIKLLINGIFDFDELARKSLGSKNWKELSSQKRERFTKAFRGMVENASVRKLEVYESDTTTYEKPEIEDDKATVVAHAMSDGVETILVYKLHKVDGRWKAWDLEIDDLSTYRNYREQFRKILETKSIDDLIALLEKKAKEEGKARKADNMKNNSEKKAL